MKRLAIVAAMLSGCASDPYWVRTVDFTPNEIVIRSAGHSFSGGFNNADNVEGYSVRNMPPGACTIFIRDSVSNRECVIAHETKHCNGWDHPNYRVNLRC